jgi:hypothetical protein
VSITGGDDLVSLALQHETNQTQGIDIIIHNENFFRHGVTPQNPKNLSENFR